MGSRFFLITGINILKDPVKEWETINSENLSVNVIRNTFVVPLVLLVSIAAFAGSLIFTHSELSPVYSVFEGIKCFLVFLITVYVTAIILKETTKALDLGNRFEPAFRLIAYSIVPFLLCQIFSMLFESLLFVNVLALYGLYIFWSGTERTLKPLSTKKIKLLAAAFIAFIGVFIASNLLLTLLIDKIFYKFFS
jgi:hypothetical protein